MDNNKLQEETVANDGHKSYNILNFKDFVQEEGKKGKKDTKKNRPGRESLEKENQAWFSRQKRRSFGPSHCVI